MDDRQAIAGLTEELKLATARSGNPQNIPAGTLFTGNGIFSITEGNPICQDIGQGPTVLTTTTFSVPVLGVGIERFAYRPLRRR